MRGHGRRAACATGAAAAIALGAAPGATAATLEAPDCVGNDSRATKLLPISGTGFVPGSFVSLSYEAPYLGVPRSAGIFRPDAAGAFAADLVPPTLDGLRVNRRRVTVRALDPMRPTLQASKTITVVRVRVTATPSRARSHRRTARFRAEGFEPGRRVYAHFQREGDDDVRTVSLGRATGACGGVSKRRRLVPGRNVRRGRWLVHVDQKREYERSTRPQALEVIRVGPTRRRR